MPHCILYRIYDEAGSIIYIGATTSMSNRLSTHARTQPWWDIAASITLEHFSTPEELFEMESEAIETEKPRFNVLGVKPAPWSKKPRREAGTGSLFQRKDGIWIARLHVNDVDGKRKLMQVSSKSREKAIYKLEQLRNQYDANDRTQAS